MARTVDVTVTVPPNLCSVADGLGLDPRLFVLAIVHYPYCTSSAEEWLQKVIEIGGGMADGSFEEMERRMRDHPDEWFSRWESRVTEPGPSVWDIILEESPEGCE